MSYLWKTLKEVPSKAGLYLTYWYGESGGHDFSYFDGEQWTEQRRYGKPISHWLDLELSTPHDPVWEPRP